MNDIKLYMNSVLSKFYKLCIRPFTDFFPYWGIIYILCTLPYVSHFISVYAIPYAGFLALHCWAMTYFLVFLGGIMPLTIRKIYQFILLLISSLFFLRDCFVAFEYGFDLQANLIAIIQGTNANEAIEYINMYFTMDKLLYLLFGIVLLVTIYLFLRKVASRLNRFIVYINLAIVCLGTVLTIFKPEVWRNALLGKIYTIVETSSTPDLNDYLSHPVLVHSQEDKPDNVVLILGESLAKCQSSLYGYGLNTNPRLSVLRDSGSLYVYNHVTSAAISTIPCFQTMMSSYRMDSKENWYECITLQEILRCSGYHTEWISNQQAYGIWDNVVSKYAELCDTSFFMNRYASFDHLGFDESLIAVTSDRLKSRIVNSSKNVFFIHLMGSHPQFNKRYPTSFEKFYAHDYLDRPVNQRQTLAEYDNSVLYNDSVVNELIQLFKDRDAVVLYLSDHGMDIYQGREDYIGHADLRNSRSVDAAKQIPFMFYLSDEFTREHHQLAEMINNNTNKAFCTDDLLYTIMDIIGVKFTNNNDVERNSLFHKIK